MKVKPSMRLIKLYRQWQDIIKFKLNKIRERDSVWLYCHSDNDAEIFNKIIEIEKTLK
jgi:hypothetical protein